MNSELRPCSECKNMVSEVSVPAEHHRLCSHGKEIRADYSFDGSYERGFKAGVERAVRLICYLSSERQIQRVIEDVMEGQNEDC